VIRPETTPPSRISKVPLSSTRKVLEASTVVTLVVPLDTTIWLMKLSPHGLHGRQIDAT
jgi:hypothetical protein